MLPAFAVEGSSGFARAALEVWCRRGVVAKSVGMFRRAVAGAWVEYALWTLRRDGRASVRRRRESVFIVLMICVSRKSTGSVPYIYACSAGHVLSPIVARG